MEALAAYSLLGLTISVAIARPRVGSLHFHHSHAGVLGAILVVSFGLVQWDQLISALELLSLPIITIVSLMAITLIAEQAGVFSVLTQYIARLADGDGRRLLALLYVCGLITGTLFTNDAAILIFTPLVFALIEDVQEPSWTRANKIPYFFGVLYVANMTGALVIANPINIVMSRILNIGFMEYARWMFFPALVSMVVSYVGLRLHFGADVPARYTLPARFEAPVKRRPYTLLCAGVLLATLIGFLSRIFPACRRGPSLSGAIVLCLLHTFVARKPLAPIIRDGIGWDVIILPGRHLHRGAGCP